MVGPWTHQRPNRTDRSVDPDHAFHDPVRTVDGLRAVPHVTRTRTMAAPPGQPGGGDGWARRNGPRDHRSRCDNGVRFRVVRTQRRAATAHLRTRYGDGGLRGRDPRTVGARAERDAVARSRRVVDAALA